MAWEVLTCQKLATSKTPTRKVCPKIFWRHLASTSTSISWTWTFHSIGAHRAATKKTHSSTVHKASLQLQDFHLGNSSQGWWLFFSPKIAVATPWKINMEVCKMIFLSKWVICIFYVNLPGCIGVLTSSLGVRLRRFCGFVFRGALGQGVVRCVVWCVYGWGFASVGQGVVGSVVWGVYGWGFANFVGFVLCLSGRSGKSMIPFHAIWGLVWFSKIRWSRFNFRVIIFKKTEIPQNHNFHFKQNVWYCWWKKSCTTWDV